MAAQRLFVARIQVQLRTQTDSWIKLRTDQSAQSPNRKSIHPSNSPAINPYFACRLVEVESGVTGGSGLQFRRGINVERSDPGFALGRFFEHAASQFAVHQSEC